MRYYIILLFSFVFSFSIAQDDAAKVNLKSPHGTIHTHLYFLQPESYDASKAAAVIHDPTLSEKEKSEVAIKIKNILDGKGNYIDLNLIPDNPNYTDSTYNKPLYFLEGVDEKIYLEKIDGSWYYSETTTNSIDVIYASTFPFGTKFLKNLLSEKIGLKKFLGLYLWQWLGLLIAVALAFVLFWIVRYIGSKIVNFLCRNLQEKSVLNVSLFSKIAAAFSLAATFYVLSKFVPSLLLPIEFGKYLIKALRIAVIIFATVLASRVLTLFMLFAKQFATRTSSKLDDQLVPILSKLGKLFLGTLGVAFCLNELNVDLLAILAGLSVGALALALAAQDTVKNFIGSITIFLDQPFEIGDFIVTNDVTGSVEEVGLRATRIRTTDQSLAYIPNGALSNMVIDNLGLRIYRRWKTELQITYETDPELLKDFIAQVKGLVNKHKLVKADKTLIHFNSLGASSLNVMMDVYIDVQSYDLDLQCREELLFAILELANKKGVDFAYPTQTLNLLGIEKKKA